MRAVRKETKEIGARALDGEGDGGGGAGRSCVGGPSLS